MRKTLFFTLFWWSFQQTKPGLYFGNARKYFVIMLTLALIVLTGLKILLLDKYDHDKTFYAVEYNDYGYLNTFHLPVLIHHARVLATGAPVLAIIIVTALGSLLWFRRWWQAAYLIAAITGFLLIMSLTHRFDNLSNYFERMLLPIPMMMAIVSASVITVTRTFLARLGAFVGLVLVLLMHFDVLRMTAQPFTARIVLLTDLCKASTSLNIKKGIVREDLLEQNTYAMTGWCTPIETLLLSSYDGKDSSVTLALQTEQIEKNEKKGIRVLPDQWIKWGEMVLPQSDLNNRYYHLPVTGYTSLLSEDTSYTGTVRLRLEGADLQKPNTLLFNIEILLDDKQILPNNGNTILRLKNRESMLLYSSNIPYRFRGSGRWNFGVSADQIPEGPVTLELVYGEKILASLLLKKNGLHISEE